MPPPFQHLTLAEFAVLLRRFPFTRQVTTVHMHHTWHPTRAHYQGHRTIVGMWEFHTEVNGWREIAQHLTIAPDGTLWLGRNWNLSPASASGHNGSTAAGPFMFEMIGNFDRGHDPFDGPQRDAALRVVSLVQRRFGLPPETLRFHNQLSAKTCPGSSVDYRHTVEAVRGLHGLPWETIASARAVARDAAGATDAEPFSDDTLQVAEIADAFAETALDAAELADAERLAEPREKEMSATTPLRHRRAATPDALRPHVVNLTDGRLSARGEITTSEGDVDELFGEHLAAAARTARERGDKLRLLFYAHGGLVSERAALDVARRRVAWWMGNRVYPVYFVWETGLGETLQQLGAGVTGRGRARGRWGDGADLLVEAGLRALGGPLVWSGMKRSAERASAPGGGARYVAEALRGLCAEYGDAVEIHAVGHSAGATFLTHFLPVALELGVPPFRSAHFLAPAVRTSTFGARLAPCLGRGVDHLTVFALRDEYERADRCAGLYHKSLLYLVHRTLEPERGAPLLGLESSLRADPELRRLFGLDGVPSAVGEVVWAVSATRAGRSASTATAHGGFDDDAPTMESVLRRVLGAADHDPVVAFGDAAPPGAERGAPAALAAGAPTRSGGRAPRRRALCVGINAYRHAPLAACVSDTRQWVDALVHTGFEPPVTLFDAQATRDAMLEALSELVETSVPGDVVVFQYAGHGTQVPDVSGDEAGGDSPAFDEAICPYDYRTGALLVDDDLAAVLARAPDGVNVTCFIDCCHSGTISRFAVGGVAAPLRDATPEAARRPRFVPADDDLLEAHRRFRGTHPQARRGLAAPRAPDGSRDGMPNEAADEATDGTAGGLRDEMRAIVFSACLSSELAWETDGHGEFSLHATRLLRAGTAGMTNEAFVDQLVAALGPAARQHPQLDCAPALRRNGLLQPLRDSGIDAAAAVPGGDLPGAYRAGANVVARPAQVAELLRQLAAAVEGTG